MKLRIKLESNGSYYIERKYWYGWCKIGSNDGEGGGCYVFNTEIEARYFIDKYLTKVETRIITV